MEPQVYEWDPREVELISEQVAVECATGWMLELQTYPNTQSHILIRDTKNRNPPKMSSEL